MNKPINMVDPAGEYRLAEGRDRRRGGRVFASGRFVLGPEGEALEREIAQFVGAAHAVGCNSGTDALHLPLVAAGIGAGDEVVIPGFTFFATGEAVSYTGATPVFADVEEGTFNLDPASLARSITQENQGGHRRAPVRPVRRPGRDRAHLQGEEAAPGRGLRAVHRRRLPGQARRKLGRFRRLLVLSDQEPRRRGRRGPDDGENRGARQDAAHAAPPRQPPDLPARARGLEQPAGRAAGRGAAREAQAPRRASTRRGARWRSAIARSWPAPR